MNKPLNSIVESFKKGYYFLEDRYYTLLDKINGHIPVYKVIDLIDKIVPSFVLLIALILLFLMFFVFISAVSSPLTATLLVVDNNGDVLGGVSIGLTIGNQAKNLLTDEWGKAKIDLLAREIEAEALFSKDGFQNLGRTITLKADETISVTMQPILKPVGFQNAERTINVLDNRTNRAVKGVTLGFECISGGLAPMPQTGDNGEFKVVQPSNCPLMIATAEADGYNKASKAIAEGITYISMTPKTIVGSITALVVDGAENPVPDVTVRAIDEVKNIEEASSNTALNGTAILQNLQPGNYSVSAISLDGRTGQKAGVLVNEGETTWITISLSDIDQASIKKIYLKLIEQGTSNAVANAQVLIYNGSVLIDSTASNSLGIAEKKLSNAGLAYLAVITHPDFVTKIEPDIPLKELSDTSPLNVPLARASMIDPATSAEAILTVVDEDNALVKDALVTIYDSRYPKIPLKTPPGKTLSEGGLKGTYAFTNLAPGTYFARAESSDGKAKGESGQGTVRAGETLRLEVKLVLGKGTVETFVFDRDSASQEPIAGATVDLIDANGSGTVLSSCQTGSSGKCESAPVPADKTVFVRASALNFVSEWAVQAIDIVDKKKAAVSIGLVPEISILPGTEKIDTKFVGLYKDSDCKTPAGFVQSDESGTTRYFAKFNLIFTENVSYKGIVQHIRAGIDSEINLLLPTGYKLKLMGVTGPLIKAALLSRCWNNDAENPFMEPASCPGNVVPSADDSAKQANIYYPDMQGLQIVPFLVEFNIEPGLEPGTEMQLHYIAKATVGNESFVTPKKVRIFLVDQALCEGNKFAWGFWAKGLLADDAITALDTAPNALNNLAMNENYALLYKAYNCSNADFFNAKIVAKNPVPNAISFTDSAPFDYGPKDLMADFSFPKDTEVSGEVQVYSALEAQSTKMEFTLSTQAGSSTETLGFSIESSLALRVDHSPQKLNPNFSNLALSGKVMDATLLESKPIEGAKVNLQISEGRSMTTVTDEWGNFTISGISDLQGLSKVTLTVRKAGYKTLLKEIEIGASPAVPNPSLDCISIRKGSSPDVNIYFEKPAAGAAVPSQAFSVVNGCNQAVTIHIASELETDKKTDFALNAGASKEVKVYAETMKPNPPFPIYMGEYGIEVLAKFSNEPLLPFSGPLKVARVYVTDQKSCFRLADPAEPSNKNKMKSSFDIHAGPDNALVINDCFVFFEDVRLPNVRKVQDFMPAEEAFSIDYTPPTQPPEAVTKTQLFDPKEDNFEGGTTLSFDVMDSGGYVFVDWVDLFMTDGNNTKGDRHRIFVQNFRNVWSSVTSLVPYIAAPHGSGLPHPIADGSDGWIDTGAYYAPGAFNNSEMSQTPIWQGQKAVCDRTIASFSSGLNECSLENYFGGKPVMPYKVGMTANKISIETSDDATKLSAVKWQYVRTDKSHGGLIDFNLKNNTLTGEAYALIEIEDTIGSSFVPGQGTTVEGDTDVEWSLSKRGILEELHEFTPLDKAELEKQGNTSGTLTLQPGYILGISVESSDPPRIFVTKSAYNGDLLGIDGADEKCQQQAEAAGLTGNWQALLSSRRLPDIDAKERVFPGVKKIVNVKGEVVAEKGGCGWSSEYGLLWGFSSNAFCNPVKYDQFGDEVPSSGPVWTGTTGKGLVNSTYTCGDWTYGTRSSGRVGNPNSVAASWVYDKLIKCTEPAHLYCIEQKSESLQFMVFGSNTTLDQVYKSFNVANEKKISSVLFRSNGSQQPLLSPEQGSILLYSSSNGTWSEPQPFGIPSTGARPFGIPSPGAIQLIDLNNADARVLAFKNDSDRSIKIDKITLNYISSIKKEVLVGVTKSVIEKGESSREFDLPPLLNDLPPGNYASIEYIARGITPVLIAYFTGTRMNISPDPYASNEKVVVEISPSQDKGSTYAERFHIRLVGQSRAQCIQGGIMGSTGPGAEPRVMFNWAWESIGIDSCNSDNPNFIYCDPAQFTISLVKRLEEMRRLAEEDLTGNLLKLREMQQFNAYLIEDAYTDDFRHDFVELFKKQFFSGDVLEGQYPWGKYLLDSGRFSFDTSRASAGQQAGQGFVDAGLHEIYIDLGFDNDQFEFFYDSPEKDLLAGIKVEIVKVSEPVTQNPFYYLPFNGEVGMLEDGTFDRQDYGLEFENQNRPLAIVESPLGFSLETDSSSGRKLVKTKMISGFDAVNLSDRGAIMKIGQNQEVIDFAPSTATPILLQMAPKDGKVEAYYWLRNELGQVQISGTQFMNIWNGVGSTMKFASGACVDYYGNELKYGIPDKIAESGTCASEVKGSYGFNYNPAEEGQLYFETVFYVPEGLAINLRKSCENNSYFYSPSSSTSTTNTLVSLNSADSRTRAVTMGDVFGLISGEYVCVSADADYYYFWWNPQKVLSGLDGTKSKIAGWDKISCEPFQ